VFREFCVVRRLPDQAPPVSNSAARRSASSSESSIVVDASGASKVSGVPWADDRRVDARMVKRPRHRERAHLDSARARFFGEGGQSPKHVAALEMSIRFRTQGHPRAVWIGGRPRGIFRSANHLRAG
jgi:hypothetical protein